eukprot:15440196-Alexandrium_andersonii.AAC.1
MHTCTCNSRFSPKKNPGVPSCRPCLDRQMRTHASELQQGRQHADNCKVAGGGKPWTPHLP